MLSLIVLSSCKKSHSGEDDPNPSDHHSPYISQIYEFRQAPGQFANDLVQTDILIGRAGEGLVSLGAYGGYIIFGFDHPVENIEGADLGIFGNPLISPGTEFSEPGIICVMQDLNKNGLPDDIWYELAGSEYNSETTTKNYSITYYRPASLHDDIRWTDHIGNEGFILRNEFHTQDYFPAWAKNDSISFSGTLLKNDIRLTETIGNNPFAFGYADNGSSEYIRLQEQYGRGYNTFDLNWAVDSGGQHVTLKSIDFVKIYTAQNHNGNPFHPDLNNERSRYIGEISTEFAGAIDLKLYNNHK